MTPSKLHSADLFDWVHHALLKISLPNTTAHRQVMGYGHSHERKTTTPTSSPLWALWSMAMTTGESLPAHRLKANTPRSLISGLRWSTWPHVCVRRHHAAQWEVLCFCAQWLYNDHKPRVSGNYKNYLKTSSLDAGLLERRFLPKALVLLWRIPCQCYSLNQQITLSHQNHATRKKA